MTKYAKNTHVYFSRTVCHLLRIFLLAGEDTASRILVAAVLFFLFRGDGDSLNNEAGFLFLGDAVSPWDEDELTPWSSGSCFFTALVKWFPKNKNRKFKFNTLLYKRGVNEHKKHTRYKMILNDYKLIYKTKVGSNTSRCSGMKPAFFPEGTDPRERRKSSLRRQQILF